MSSGNMISDSSLTSKNLLSFILTRRKGIMNTIKVFYMAFVKENIPIYAIVNKFTLVNINDI